MGEELTRAGILEALLFVAEDPLPLARLQEALGDSDPAATGAALRELALSLEQAGRGLMVQEVAGGFRLATRPEAHPWIQRLQQVKPARLSRPALETLAIIAYRQPITKAEIEKVRGVAVDGVVRTLLERDLIRILGRKAEAGRPIVYGTSTSFLEHFGFRELGDLPTLKEIDELLGTPTPGAAGAGQPDAVVEAEPAGAEGAAAGDLEAGAAEDGAAAPAAAAQPEASPPQFSTADRAPGEDEPPPA
ncbi:MAG: SMC-Scp complex subunit ScpB [Candidatus Methylomirabilales bacterium]